MYSSSVAPVAPGVFDCSIHCTEQDVAWVRLAGELDVATSPLLAQRLDACLVRDPGPRLVVVDLRELEFADTSAVHTITDAERRSRDAGGRLVLVRGPPAVDRVFTLTGAGNLLEIVDLHPAEPAVSALLHLARAEGA